MNPEPDTLLMSDTAICARIQTLTSRMMGFWKNASGWAPAEAAGLLNTSMLEWQTSLSESLCQWLDSSTDGDLILAWANLGALVEGQLKLFLSVWYDDYKSDADAIRGRNQTLRDPDGCQLESLRQFYVRRIWTATSDWDDYIELVQHRRNAIHAFQMRNIGTFEEWRDSLRTHLSFVRCINGKLSYPDDVYAPREL